MSMAMVTQCLAIVEEAANYLTSAFERLSLWGGQPIVSTLGRGFGIFNLAGDVQRVQWRTGTCATIG